MPEEKRVECVLDQFGLRRLYSMDRLFSGAGQSSSVEPLWQPQVGVGQSARCAVVPDVGFVLPLGACEFVGAQVDALCEGRMCVDGVFCPLRCFGDPKVYVLCPARLEKLAGEKKPVGDKP